MSQSKQLNKTMPHLYIQEYNANIRTMQHIFPVLKEVI